MTPLQPLYSPHPTALSHKMRVGEMSSKLYVPLASSDSFNSSTVPETDYVKNNGKYYNHGLVAVVILSITMVIFMMFAIVGNVLVILTIIRHKGMKTRTNMFIINLAVADILVALFNMPFSLVTVICGEWIFGEVFCQFNGFVVPLFFIVSIHTLIYISIHKFISITRPFSHTMTPRKILAMIAATWIWGIICATATLKGGNHVLYKKGASQCGPSLPNKLNEYIHSLLITTCNYIVPLVVMSSCYFNIFREIHRHLIRIRQTSNMDLQNSLRQQRRISFTLFLVLACFVICWTPFIWYSCAAAFSKDKAKIPLLANPVAYWCGYMNSACNPIIYALRSPSFRQGYKEIICSQATYAVGASTITRPSLSPFTSLHGKSRKRLSDPIQNIRLLSSPAKLAAKRMHRSTNWTSYPSLHLRNRIKDVSKTPFFSKSNMNMIQNNHSKYLEHNYSWHASMSNVCDVAHSSDMKKAAILRRATSAPSLGTSKRENGLPGIESIAMFEKELTCPATSSFGSENNICACYSEVKNTKHFHGTVEKLPHDSQNYENGLCLQKSSHPLVIIDDPSPVSSNEFCRDGYLDGSCSDVEFGMTQRFALVNCVGRSCPDQVRSEDPWDITTRNPGQWSPASVKSLEMSRNLRRNSKMSAKKTELVPLTKKADEPESPLYSASREQLMKWMSQDCLDRIGTIEKEFALELFTTEKVA